MKVTRISSAAGAGLVAIALLGACSSSSSTKTPASGATPAAGATTAATKASSAQPTTAKRTEVDNLQISAKDFSFKANLTSVHPGAPGVDVSFKNEGSATHTLTFYTDADFKTKLGSADSSKIAGGGSVGFPFIPPDGAKSVYYRCEIHPTQMKGELAVK